MRRIGRFYVSRELFEAGDMLPLFACVAVVRCEFSYRFEYVGVSPQFDEVFEGDLIPLYTWTAYTTEPLGQITLTAVRSTLTP